jgi:hypothetical protein
LSLSARTVKDRIERINKEVSNMQIGDINSSNFLSLAINDSTDFTGIAQCCVMTRYITSLGIQEELIELLPLKGQTRRGRYFGKSSGMFKN